jgi:lysophospholipase L1-like esterase
MKPIRIFIFLTAVALLLFLLSLVFPSEGISLTPDIQLQFLKISDLKENDSLNQDLAVEQLLAASSVTDDPEAEFTLLVQEERGDTLPLQVVDPANVDSLRKALQSIRFPDEQDTLLDPFFLKLRGLADAYIRETRILHFGDSQIEMDRMTALIRFRLQKQFGGTGTGLVQAMPLYAGHMAYEQEEEGEWLRYTYFGTRDSTILHNSYGIMGAFTSVPSPKEDAWPAISYRFRTGRRTGNVDRVRVFLHSYTDSARMAFAVNDTLGDTIRNMPGGFNVADYRHHEQIGNLEISMALPEGGRIYGISFESHSGLQVDNIAMRGGSGLIFTKMNRDLQLRMMEYLRPGLIILQYGGNVVPYIDANRYHRSFLRELAFLKDLCPGVPILVIGPSDMSQKVKGKFESLPGVEPVRDALKKAALESECAFWDLYEAMGGHNSMPSFVEADPPLASTDYVHFTAVGVNLMAEMFYNALMDEYNRFLLRMEEG